jgi:uncharacterized membrane protein
MNKNKILMMAAVTGLALGGANAYAGKAGYEKCKGVAPKGANGCGANDHKCGGFAKTDFDSEEWVYVKEGSCAEIKKAMKSPALREYAREIAKSAVKYQDNAPK